MTLIFALPWKSKVWHDVVFLASACEELANNVSCSYKRHKTCFV